MVIGSEYETRQVRGGPLQCFVDGVEVPFEEFMQHCPAREPAAVPSLSDVLHTVSTDKDEWHRNHQGPLVEIIGYVWRCGDDCGCSKPEIVARFRNLTDPRWIVPRLLWEGEFYIDFESGAEDDLAAKLAELQATEPELAARIKRTGP